jgi:hypothetical protein
MEKLVYMHWEHVPVPPMGEYWKFNRYIAVRSSEGGRSGITFDGFSIYWREDADVSGHPGRDGYGWLIGKFENLPEAIDVTPPIERLSSIMKGLSE